MSRNIPLMNISEGMKEIMPEMLDKIKKLVENNQFIGGNEVSAFEEEFAEFSGARYSVGCSNGTEAIEVALRALGIGRGDVVLVPANSFISSAEAVINVGAEIDLIDVEDEYYNICPEKVIEYLDRNKDKNIKAILAVHLYGQMADMSSLKKIADKYDLFLVEDSAQAHGSMIENRQPAYWGDIATYSFYPGKNLGAFGDAGAITTNNEDLYEKCKKIVNHGRAKGEKYLHDIIGGNKRLDTIQAAVLRIKLRELSKWNDLRKHAAEKYSEKLKAFEGINIPKIRESADPVWYVYTIRVNDRDNVRDRLQEDGISTGLYYPVPLHLQPSLDFLGYKKGDFPISEIHSAEIMSLPMWPEIQDDDINYVISALSKYISC